MVCLICNIEMAYFDSYGALSRKSDRDIDEILSLLKKFCLMLHVGNVTIVARNGKEEFHIRADMCRDFIYEVFECAMKKVGNTDGEYCKYSAGHFTKMLL